MEFLELIRLRSGAVMTTLPAEAGLACVDE
jgi:hypothetical protein